MNHSNIEDIIKKQKWANNGLLVLPSYTISSLEAQHKTTEIDKTMTTCITHEQIFGSKYTINMLKSELTKFSIYDCLASLSKIGIIIENDGMLSEELQAKMAAELFPKETNKKIMSFLQSKRVKSAIIFSEKQTLKLIKYSLLFASDIPANDFNDKKDSYNFLNLLLGVNDLFLYDAGKPSVKDQKEEILRYTIQNSDLSLSEQFRYLLGRYIQLFLKIPALPEFVDYKNRVDLENEFFQATTFKLSDYMMVGFSLLANFLSKSVVRNQLGNINWGLNKDTYFCNTEIKGQEPQRIFKSFAITLDDLKKEIKKPSLVRMTLNIIILL